MTHPAGMTTDSPDVVWRRSARARRISLRVDPRSGTVVLTLPARAARAAGLAVLQAHAGWVRERLARLPAPVRLQDGAMVPLGGVPHRVRHRPGLGGSVVAGGELQVGGAPEALPRRVTDLLRGEARRSLGAQAAAKAGRAGLALGGVVVRDTRSRWGSCTAAGTLMFCWRLVMAPLPVQDYVVAHEVAHLRHMDHGRAFWALVDSLTPHRRMAEAWLSAEGAGLQRVG